MGHRNRRVRTSHIARLRARDLLRCIRITCWHQNVDNRSKWCRQSMRWPHQRCNNCFIHLRISTLYWCVEGLDRIWYRRDERYLNFCVRRFALRTSVESSCVIVHRNMSSRYYIDAIYWNRPRNRSYEITLTSLCFSKTLHVHILLDWHCILESAQHWCFALVGVLVRNKSHWAYLGRHMTTPVYPSTTSKQPPDAHPSNRSTRVERHRQEPNLATNTQHVSSICQGERPRIYPFLINNGYEVQKYFII